MLQITDNLGVTYTVKENASVIKINAIIEQYLGNQDSVMPSLTALLEVDASMPMAHCLRAYLLKLAGDPRFSTVIAEEINHLDAQIEVLNTRERLHLQALSAWCDNQNDKAAAILETLLETSPKDMIALRISHYFHFYAGDSAMIRDSIKRSVDVWSSTDPFYGYLLGMFSFGLEESGDYESAEKNGRQAVELNPMDLWASHAVSHVMQMQGRAEEGVAWLKTLIPKWSNTNNFVYHLHWHQALFHIGLGEYDAALEIYDTQLLPVLKDDFYLDICNATSLLWRLEIHGIAVGDRWLALSQFSDSRIKDDELVFSTLHYAMIPARLNNSERNAESISHFEKWSQQDTAQGKICHTVGLPLAHALVQIGEKKYQHAANTIKQVQDKIIQIGGSHAQRHLFDELQNYAEKMR